MWKNLAAMTAVPLMIVLAAPAHAVPNWPNYGVFLQDIAFDGIVMDPDQAVLEGQAVCRFVAPPDGGSLWDAGQHVLSMHPDWGIDASLKFANRAIQNICSTRESFTQLPSA